MRIKLIAPHDFEGSSISSAEAFNIQRVSLPLLAALTPTDHTVTIVEEVIAPDDVDEDVDLVGITVMTDLAPRAYKLADRYRQRGVKVVMGGIHPSVLPDETLKHADSLVVGEAENVWARLVSDVASGQMQNVYRAGKTTDLKGLPRPRRNLYAKSIHKGYTPSAFGVEASRGCPHDCEFCSVSQVMGRGYRLRPVQEVIAEMESIDFPRFFFVDDSLALNRTAAKSLFAEMIPLRTLWVGQGTVSLAEDLELLRLMWRAGCRALLIGFESVQINADHGMGKIRNLKFDFPEAIRRFHGEGISILGAFVFGFDHENKDVFDQTLEFCMKCRLDGAQLRILTPFPGTRLYARLLKERRLFVPDWWLQGYSSRALLFRPRFMTEDEIMEGVARLQRHIYSFDGIIKRFFGMSLSKRTAVGARLYTGFNLAMRRRYFKELKEPPSSPGRPN
jgi:radical SAM superfamily enzyme YgiQ (UPF0313 family)